MARKKAAAKAVIEVVEIPGAAVRAVAVVPRLRPGELQIAFEDDDGNGGAGRRVVICLKDSRHLRMNLAMALLGADGAKANVKLTWPKPPKAPPPPKKPKPSLAENLAKARAWSGAHDAETKRSRRR